MSSDNQENFFRYPSDLNENSLDNHSLSIDRNIISNKYQTLPSPNDLRGKIIIKVK